MHTADTPQGKTKYILHAQQLMVMKMLMKVFFFPGGPRSTLCVGGSSPLLCGSTCL